MKTALLTHFKIPNFGSNLQALAAHKVLAACSDSVVLNYTPEKLERRYSELCPKEQVDEHTSFANEYLRLSPILKDENELLRYCKDEKIDCIFSGSDTIFRLTKGYDTHEGSFPNPYWLKWAHSDASYNPKIAYISGSASDSAYYSFPSDWKRDIMTQLKKADYLSVRDSWTRLMFNVISLGKINPPITPDPVFILPEMITFPEKYSAGLREKKGKYILVSTRNHRVSSEWLKKFVAICHKAGFEVYGVCLPETNMEFDGFDKNIKLPLSPAAWFSLIQNAGGVFGERFHLAVTSMANTIPFVSIDHYRREGIKGRFMFLNIPMTSKVHDVLKKADLLTQCINHLKIQGLDPEAIFEKIKMFPVEKMKEFTLNERKTFDAMIRGVVGS